MNDKVIHPAVLANMNSIKYAMEGNKEAWLALYADNAVLRDPVGKSPLDPKGEGHHGIKAIEAFWDKIIGPSHITITPIKRCPSGANSCGVYMTIENDLAPGLKTKLDMIAVYEVNESGKIVAMSAYWDFSELEKQMSR